jgi:hypothetical protein
MDEGSLRVKKSFQQSKQALLDTTMPLATNLPRIRWTAKLYLSSGILYSATVGFTQGMIPVLQVSICSPMVLAVVGMILITRISTTELRINMH